MENTSHKIENRGWVTYQEPQLLLLTKELAIKFVKDYQTPEGDRNLKPFRVEYLLDQVKKGYFRGCDWAVARNEETGKVYRVNGQHTSHIFANIIVPPKNCWVTISYFSCKDQVEITDLWETFDNYSQVRNIHESIKMRIACIEELKGIKETLVSKVASGLRFYHHGKLVNTRESLSRSKIVENDVDFVLYACNLVGDKWAYRHCMRIAPIAALRKLYEVDMVAAAEFYNLIGDGSGYDNPKAPTRRCYEFLIRMPKNTSLRDEMSVIIQCWNAWRLGKMSVVLRMGLPELPIPI